MLKTSWFLRDHLLSKASALHAFIDLPTSNTTPTIFKKGYRGHFRLSDRFL